MIDHRPSGLDRYARALVAALPPRAPELRFTVVLRPGVECSASGTNVQIARVPGWMDYPDNWLRGRQLNRLGADLYHALHHFLPLGLIAPRVIFTLHDLIWVEHAHLTFDTRFARIKQRWVNLLGWSSMGYAMRRADHLIAISHYTKERAQRRYGIPSARITTVHHGINTDEFTPDAPIAPSSGEEGDATTPYFICVGNTRPYKNLRGVIHALAVLAPRHPELVLVIAGRGHSMPHLRRLAGQLGVLPRIHFTGFVSPGSLRRLVVGARALVFPSFIEGFGFPLLEAMAAGCPVISSDIPVVREIVQEAALLADPHNPEAIAAAMEEVLNSSERREALRRAGAARSRQFSWDRCAEETLSVYRRLLASGSRADEI